MYADEREFGEAMATAPYIEVVDQWGDWPKVVDCLLFSVREGSSISRFHRDLARVWSVT